jgi:hypothetical protein
MACFLRPLEFYRKTKSVVHVNKCPQASNSDVIINTGTTKHKSTDTIDRINKNGGVRFKTNVILIFEFLPIPLNPNSPILVPLLRL